MTFIAAVVASAGGSSSRKTKVYLSAAPVDFYTVFNCRDDERRRRRSLMGSRQTFSDHGDVSAHGRLFSQSSRVNNVVNETVRQLSCPSTRFDPTDFQSSPIDDLSFEKSNRGVVLKRRIRRFYVIM